MSSDTIVYVIMCLIALSIVGVYLYFIYKDDKKKQEKNDLYHDEILNRLDDIERSIKYEKNK